jgi:ABC-type maltose transport system permease subunit
MFVHTRIINRKEKKNPSQIIIDTFAVIFSLFLKFPLYVIILFYRLNTSLQKTFLIKINISLLNLKQIITNSLK